MRPLGVWLLALPLALGVLSLLGLTVVGAVHTGSLATGAAFGVLALGFASLARPLAVRDQLSKAILAASTGDPDEAYRRWTRLAGAWWATRAGRDQAALNLGADALRSGDRREARARYEAVGGGRARVFAETALALLDVLDNEMERAESHLQRASMGGRAAQGEVDGVRLLLVLRLEGPRAALELGERLDPPEPGLLFASVLAAARRRASGVAPSPALVQTIASSGLQAAIPELAELLDEI